MNVDRINTALLQGDSVEVMDLLGLSRDKKYLNRLSSGTAEAASIEFQFEDWPLDQLPVESGLISIRGPRQYGKTTWLNKQILKTVDEFGPGSVGYLNGDLIANYLELREVISTLANTLNPKAKTRRIFIDEISAVSNWETGIKPLLDAGVLSNILIITTGSRASDLRRGMERLPGRKGRLDRSSYIFFPLSFQSFCKEAQKFNILDDKELVDMYLLSGGSPRAAAELIATRVLPEYVLETIRDWIYGELAQAGRSRSYLISVLQTVLERGGHPVGFTKLAREAGLANNTAASEYIDQLSDLFVIGSSYAWDLNHKRANFRRPCKFHFTNILTALAWMPNAPRNVEQLRDLPDDTRGSLYEWLAAQELFRRNTFLKSEFPEQSYYWLSDRNELDFVLSPEAFVETKNGRSSALEFGWFSKVHPKANLTVVSESSFEAVKVRGVTWAEWLKGEKS